MQEADLARLVGQPGIRVAGGGIGSHQGRQAYAEKALARRQFGGRVVRPTSLDLCNYNYDRAHLGCQVPNF